MKDTLADIRDELDEAILTRLQELLDQGMPPDSLSDAHRQALEEAAVPVGEGMVDMVPEVAVNVRGDQDAFIDDLRDIWGDALDGFLAAVNAADELCTAHYYANRDEAMADGDHMFSVLTGLGARGIRTAREAYFLLANGLPVGANSRARSLHELAVVAAVIGEHGRDTDVVERYLLHRDVDAWRQMCDHNAKADALDLEPIPDDEMREAQEVIDGLSERFGSGFRGSYGWADGLVAQPSLADLEDIVELDYVRPFYRRASHEVHATARGHELNFIVEGDRPTAMTGPVLYGLAEPARSALLSLFQVVLTTVIHARPESSPADVVFVLAWEQVIDHTCDAFDAAHPEAERVRESVVWPPDDER